MHRRDFLTTLLTATAALAVTRTALAQPAPAGAMPAPVYLAMATKGGLFLENTARDAHAKTRNPRVKAFSRAEVTEQVNLARKLDPYLGAGAPMAGAPAGPAGLVGGLVEAPLAVAGGVAGATVGAVGGVLGVPGGRGPGGMTTDEQKAQILSQLSGMQPGPEYDAMFVNASLQGHQEALNIHGSYAQAGDDPGLRRIAAGAIPLIQRHIAQLSRMQATMGSRREG
ncbi:putative outer membrane protein [Methylobacterium sp. RAS18]|nr:putative outer membrane protein [Methylobacterium sp. RAS18]